MPKFKVGSRVKMTSEALENYGQEWADVVLEVTHAANKYMPAAEFYAKGRPNGYHPGYDTGVSPQSLYDLRRADNRSSVQFSLYDWELQTA